MHWNVRRHNVNQDDDGDAVAVPGSLWCGSHTSSCYSKRRFDEMRRECYADRRTNEAFCHSTRF
ncbi:hypothetical protein BDFB_011912 [Asbolus verrucosus]|uniref:Uncharacterized protein n=1 Tax=Asbolus verrucosus TaxID=1661398 RepID=A0A482VZ33_ASBVE|nr:hypothetical protein BDFB_011912 [Asbolus verrucosus]